MRLLNSRTLELKSFHNNIPPYAILSHRWGHEQDEVTYNNIKDGQYKKLPGFAKITWCCHVAFCRGLDYVWIDTCCIDRSSSSELQESINSMYAWYAHAKECYAFLNDVHSHELDEDEFYASAWFTRGWTLQELIAPITVQFYNSHWQYLGSKADLADLIQQRTMIPRDVLRKRAILSEFSIAQRMSWAADRATTRVEDRAYSLLGIFKVNMPMLYGEGVNAFRRLQEEIIKQSDDQTILTWQDNDLFIKPVLAPSPSCFRNLSALQCIYPTNDARIGHRLASSGLEIHLMLIPWTMNTYVAPLSAGRVLSPGTKLKRRSKRGYDRIGIFLRQAGDEYHLIRVSVDGLDFVMLDSDVVAHKRDILGLRDRRVFLKGCVDHIPKALFYGFHVLFKHRGLFESGRRPRVEDVICHNYWDQDHAIFVGVPRIHPTIVRLQLNGISDQLYMHLGFDLNFAPLCLITSRRPGSEAFIGEEYAKTEFRKHAPKLGRFLGLHWLLSEVSRGECQETILAFKGHPRLRTEVFCVALSLKITFETKPLESLSEDIWHVVLEELPRNGLRHTRATPRPSDLSGSKRPEINSVKQVLEKQPTNRHRKSYDAGVLRNGFTQLQKERRSSSLTPGDVWGNFVVKELPVSKTVPWLEDHSTFDGLSNGNQKTSR